MDLPYEDIFLEGLEERVEKDIEGTEKYYDEQDNQKQEEIDKYGQ